MGLLISLAVVLAVIIIVVWRKEVGALIGRTWLYSLIIRDICLRKSTLNDLHDTRQYRLFRSAHAHLDMEDLLESAELALFAAAHARSREMFHVPLWELRGNYYFIDLVAKKVKCTRKTITVPSSIETVLDEFREVYPDYDPYMCFRLRFTDALHMVEDYSKMEED